MAEQTPVYTPDEQLKLTELSKQVQGFAAFKTAVARSLSSGQDSVVIANLLKFLSDIEVQSNNQMQEINIAAKKRLTEVKGNS